MTSSPVKCVAIIKSSGLPCKNDGIYKLGEQYYCGVHIPKDKKDQAEAVSKPKTRSVVSAAVTLMNVCDEMDEAITRRISVGDIGDVGETGKIDTRLTKFTTMSQEHRRIIIQRSFELAGSKDNVELVMARIPTALSDLIRAIGEKRHRIIYKSHYLSSLKNCEISPVDEPRGLYMEDGNVVSFPDVSINVANCSKPYLEEAGMRSIRELCEQENVIYMGPKGALISPIGMSEPEEDSEWYIPLPPTCKLRMTHNKIKIEEILASINNGTDTREKYLALRGKVLACVCLPSPCHCMVYVEVVRALEQEERAARTQTASSPDSDTPRTRLVTNLSSPVTPQCQEE